MSPCPTCKGRGVLGVHVHTDPGTGEHLGDEVEYCGDCVRGWVIPEHVIEAAAKAVFSTKWGPSMNGSHPGTKDYEIAIAALVAGLEADRDKEKQ